MVFKVVLIFFYGNATPYWDQWNGELGALYLPWLNGTLRLSDLLATHNEHRIFTMRVLSLGLLVINNSIWNPLLEMYVNAFIHTIALTFLLYCLNQCIDYRHRKYSLLFSMALLLIPFGWENTLAGFQSQFYLLLLFSLIFLWTISCEKLYSLRWWIGIFAGVLCPLSLASGALTLFIGALVVLIRKYFFQETSEKSLFVVAIALFLLGVTALFYTPNISYHDSLKAHTLTQFLKALLTVCAWPMSNGFWAMIIQAPILILTYLFFTSADWRSRQSYLYFISVGGWVFSQYISIAYGRYSGTLSSRYLDLFAIGLIANFCIFFIFFNKRLCQKRKFIKAALFIWLTLVGFGLSQRLPVILDDLNNKKELSMQQEKNVRAYLCTGKITNLINKPFQHIPYPDAYYLRSMLDNPKIKGILPGNIYMGNSSLKINSDGTPYCDLNSLDTPFIFLDKKLVSNEGLATYPKNISDGWGGQDYFKSDLPGVKVVGSFVTSDGDIGIVKFALKKGDQILYRSGPRTTRQVILIDGGLQKFLTILPQSTEWSTLNFSNPSLPEKFEVMLIDAGTGWGEWIAVGFKEK